MSLVPLTSSSKGKEVVLANKTLKTDKEVRTVLEEDEYVGKLEEIIQQDFYPDLPKLRAQNEYLAAVEKNDTAKIRELQIRFSTRRRTDRIPSPTRRSPKTFETPVHDDQRPSTSADNNDIKSTDDNESSSKQKSLENLSVDQYLDKYTSEDNASFEELADLQTKRERIKHGWMYRAEEEHLRNKVAQGSQALKGADEQLALPEPKPKALDNWSYKARNSVLFHPEDAAWTDEEKIKRQKMCQREIFHQNTRFDKRPFEDVTGQERLNKASVLHAAINKGKIDVTGQEEVGLKNPIQPYGFVATPSPAPGVEESPLMTWGEIDGTPFRLDAGDVTVPDTGPVFKVPEVPQRDQLAQEMADEIARRYRDKRKKAADKAASYHSRTPRFGSTRSTEALVTMSPAARRLATSKLGIRVGSDKALKASYTPSPHRSTGSTPGRTPTPLVVKKKRPNTNQSTSDQQSTTSITDNLLNLKGRRPRASDFF